MSFSPWVLFNPINNAPLIDINEEILLQRDTEHESAWVNPLDCRFNISQSAYGLPPTDNYRTTSDLPMQKVDPSKHASFTDMYYVQPLARLTDEDREQISREEDIPYSETPIIATTRPAQPLLWAYRSVEDAGLRTAYDGIPVGIAPTTYDPNDYLAKDKLAQLVSDLNKYRGKASTPELQAEWDVQVKRIEDEITALKLQSPFAYADPTRNVKGINVYTPDSIRVEDFDPSLGPYEQLVVSLNLDPISDVRLIADEHFKSKQAELESIEVYRRSVLSQLVNSDATETRDKLQKDVAALDRIIDFFGSELYLRSLSRPVPNTTIPADDALYAYTQDGAIAYPSRAPLYTSLPEMGPVQPWKLTAYPQLSNPDTSSQSEYSVLHITESPVAPIHNEYASQYIVEEGIAMGDTPLFLVKPHIMGTQPTPFPSQHGDRQIDLMVSALENVVRDVFTPHMAEARQLLQAYYRHKALQSTENEMGPLLEEIMRMITILKQELGN